MLKSGVKQTKLPISSFNKNKIVDMHPQQFSTMPLSAKHKTPCLFSAKAPHISKETKASFMSKGATHQMKSSTL